MRSVVRFVCAVLILTISIVLFSFHTHTEATSRFVIPYKQAGLTERQAAAHLVSRFTFGARPGEINKVIEMGLERWFNQQLDAGIADNELNERLADYDALKLSNTEVVNTYLKPAQLVRMAIKDGIVEKDSINKADKGAYRAQVADYMRQKGLKPQRELFRQLAEQKVLRAVYSNNQLQEVLTDFWFNHFNVSITKNDCAEFIPNYERDVIRPHVFGKFEDLLLATAKSPAMLLYLDNFLSAGNDSTVNVATNGRAAAKGRRKLQLPEENSSEVINSASKKKKNQGLNENYAREVMELHTLGVEGGYNQRDVTQAARVLTGWTVYPMSDNGPGNAIRKVIERIGEEKLAARGFVHDGDFLFAANRHDMGEKMVLGKTFKAGGGYEEGVQLLKMLARHPSTAKFIVHKIAVRFVNDNPPASLVDRMTKTFIDKGGDIREVLVTMVASPEFRSKSAVREKTKSPFELAVSAARGLNADIKVPYQLYTWIDKMGQKMYFYQAPTGYPDKGQYWINTGALLNRMNFGLALATQRISGIKINLLELNQGHEPESAEAALRTYGKMMMPERDLQQTIQHLMPLLNDPQLQQKVEKKADRQPLAQASAAPNEEMLLNNTKNSQDKSRPVTKSSTAVGADRGNYNMLSQVVGIIIGSPEFQRR